MSERTATCIRIKKETHPFADLLSVVKIGGYQVVVNTASWEDNSLAVYIEPDTVVNATVEPFKFLANENKSDEENSKVLVTAKKLRGILSVGLLVPCPEGFVEGDNLWNHFSLSHYEDEPEALSSGDSIPGPEKWRHISKYDLDNGRANRVKSRFVDGEEVVVQEKINGENIAVVYLEDTGFHVRSRNNWKPDTGKCNFWRGLRNTAEVMEFCKNNPGYLVRGELYGHVGGWKYDVANSPEIIVFDIKDPNGNYLNFSELQSSGMYLCPYVKMKFDYEKLLEMADEKESKAGATYKEGIVIRPVIERFGIEGRAIMKIVSNTYLQKKKA